MTLGLRKKSSYTMSGVEVTKEINCRTGSSYCFKIMYFMKVFIF